MGDETKDDGQQSSKPAIPNSGPDKTSTTGQLRTLIENVPVVAAAVESNSADIEKLKTQNDLGMRRLAQWFSIYVFTLYFGTLVVFAWAQRPLVLPEFVNQLIWIFMAGPWCGTGLSRLFGFISEKRRSE